MDAPRLRDEFIDWTTTSKTSGTRVRTLSEAEKKELREQYEAWSSESSSSAPIASAPDRRLEVIKMLGNQTKGYPIKEAELANEKLERKRQQKQPQESPRKKLFKKFSARNVRDFFKGESGSPKSPRLTRTNSKRLKRSSSMPKNILKEKSELNQKIKSMRATKGMSLKKFSDEFSRDEIWDAVKHGFDGEGGFIKDINRQYETRNKNSRDKIPDVLKERMQKMVLGIQNDKGSFRFKEYVLNYFEFIRKLLDDVQFSKQKHENWKEDFSNQLSKMCASKNKTLQEVLNCIKEEVEKMDSREQAIIYSVFEGKENFDNMLMSLNELKLNSWVKKIHEKSMQLARQTKELINSQENEYELPVKKIFPAKGEYLWKKIEDFRRSLFENENAHIEEIKINDQLIKLDQTSLSEEKSFYCSIFYHFFKEGWDKGRLKQKKQGTLEDVAREEAENLLADKETVEASSVHHILWNLANNAGLEDYELFQRRWPSVNQFMSGGLEQKKWSHQQEEYLQCKKDNAEKEPIDICIKPDGRSFTITRTCQLNLGPLVSGLLNGRIGDSYANITWVTTSEGKISRDEDGKVRNAGTLKGRISDIKFVDGTSLEKRLEIIERLNFDKKNVINNQPLRELFDRSGSISLRSQSNRGIEPKELTCHALHDEKKVANRLRSGLKRKRSSGKEKI